MSDTPAVGIIRPEEVAAKIAAIYNYEQPKLLKQILANPRLVEMVWAIQHASMQPGGLPKFCEEMVDALPHRLGTKAMRAARGKTYTIAQIKAIVEGLPFSARPELFDSVIWHLEAGTALGELSAELARELERFDSKAYDADFFRSICRRAAIENLPSFLAALCASKSKGFDSTRVRDFEELAKSLDDDDEPRERPRPNDIWFIDDPIAAVMEMMDRRAQEVSKRLAMTEVTKKVFDALDYALQEHAMVRIEGASRFGKTESVRAWCDMRPGRARLVAVPSSNTLSDLYRSVAKALGMDVSYGTRAQRLKERIEFVLQHCGMFIVLDEAAFLVPQNFTAATAPARLNWVRTEIVDRGLPLGIVVTPQSFLPQVNKFIKKTGYAMEQFFGRNHRVVQLPDELGEADMIAVARVHFPELDNDYLALIADLAGMSENYLQAVEAIAKLARYIARREKHRRITVADLEAAASEVIPRRAVAQTDDGALANAPWQRPLKGISRGVKPASNGRSEPETFPSRSLRGVGPEKVETELVSAET